MPPPSGRRQDDCGLCEVGGDAWLSRTCLSVKVERGREGERKRGREGVREGERDNYHAIFYNSIIISLHHYDIIHVHV